MNVGMMTPDVLGQHLQQRDIAHQWVALENNRIKALQPGFNFGFGDQSLPTSFGARGGTASASISPTDLQFSASSATEIASPETPRSSTNGSSISQQSFAQHGRRDSAADLKAAEEAAAIDRSERARKAANRRHSRAKESSGNNNESDGKRSRQDIEREKNRVAAAKCRKKKRMINDALDAEYRAAAAANSRMKREHRELREQLTYLRMLALQHNSGQFGCQCEAVQRYNIEQAFKIAACDGERMIQTD